MIFYGTTLHLSKFNGSWAVYCNNFYFQRLYTFALLKFACPLKIYQLSRRLVKKFPAFHGTRKIIAVYSSSFFKSANKILDEFVTSTYKSSLSHFLSITLLISGTEY
jgi:hypothetical protein